ncbi:MAG: right-handed parallel beta-helix repeat-containing protein [Planctomycetia bacterium]|nr:right-handed parallel beta-helix repeat-containing protein [Planctomycetia bacterium]
MLERWSCLCAAAAAVCLWVPATGSGKTIELYVATDGRDTNPATKEAPLQSLEAARDAVRRLKRSEAPDGGITVWVRGGVYPRADTFELTAEDSGTAPSPVAYRAYPTEQVRLVGGREIPREWFQPVIDEPTLARLDEAVRGKVLQADLKGHGILDYGPPGLEGTMELFCGATRMPLARWPNDGWALAVRDEPSTSKLFTVKFEGNGPKRWSRMDQVLLHGYWQVDYSDGVINAKEAGIDLEKRKITLSVPEDNDKPRRFYALNVLEEIDKPGEWYLDRERGVLYFLPPPEFPESRVMVSLLKEPLVVLREASFVTLRGLTLEMVRGQAVVIQGGTHNQVAGCTIRNTAADAVALSGGTDNGILGCDIHDVGSTAIVLAGGDRATLTPAGLYVVNSHIHHFARLGRGYRPAVRMEGVGQRIAHNLIHDAPHAAILYSGNDHLIELNEIHDVVLETSDAGVLYTGYDWTARGNVVRHNFMHHVPHIPGGYTRVVYLDDGHCSTETFGNVFYKTHETVWIGGGRDNAVENNIFIECEVPVGLDNRGLRWTFLNPDGDITATDMYKKLAAFDYKNPPWSTRYPKLARILDEQPRAPLGNTLRRNVSVRSNWRDPEKVCRETSPKQIDEKYMVIEDNYVTQEDPGFVDAANMNFQLRDDSIVYKQIPGFQKIPFADIGPYPDEYRATWPIDRR